jgi:hypothetical protein
MSTTEQERGVSRGPPIALLVVAALISFLPLLR